MTIRERLKGWRTVIWHSVVGAAGITVVITDQLQMVDWSRAFPPQTAGMIFVGLAVAGILFRVITTSELGKKC